MDPNANLQEQGTCLDMLVIFAGESVNEWRRRTYATSRRLTDLRHALREWIDNGGFEPDWSLQPRAAKYYRKDN